MYLLLKLPRDDDQTASRIVHTSSDFVVPKVAQRDGNRANARWYFLPAHNWIIKGIALSCHFIIIACVPNTMCHSSWQDHLTAGFGAGWVCLLFRVYNGQGRPFKLNYASCGSVFAANVTAALGHAPLAHLGYERSVYFYVSGCGAVGSAQRPGR